MHASNAGAVTTGPYLVTGCDVENENSAEGRLSLKGYTYRAFS